MTRVPTLSRCWQRKGLIHHVRRRWIHKETLLPFSSLGGNHIASPFPPDETSAGENPPQPAKDGVPPDRDPRPRKGGASA